MPHLHRRLDFIGGFHLPLFTLQATIAIAAIVVFSGQAVRAQTGERRWLETTISPAPKAKRVALVIGNTHYIGPNALKNPENDAHDMAHTLQALGFEVLMCLDRTNQEMDEDIDEFGKRAEGSTVCLFYFSGHGSQLNGENYLIPVSFNGHSESDVKYNTVNVGRLLDALTEAKSKVSIVILDACRDNPFAHNTRSLNRGLATMTAPSNTLISYATGPGSTAEDNPDGVNGLFTQELLRQMRAPGLQIEDVFKNTRKAVKLASNGKQIPWEESSLEDQFFFNATTTGVHAPVMAVSNKPIAHNAATSMAELLAHVPGLLQEAKQGVVAISDVSQKDEILYQIVTAQTKTGDVAAARITFQGIGGADCKAKALSMVAIAQAQAGDVAAARATLQEAEQEADEVGEGRRKAVALHAIVRAKTQLSDFAGAERTAERIGDAGQKRAALVTISAARAQSGDVAGAVRTAEGNSDLGYKAWAFSLIADAMAHGGDAAGAKAILEEAKRAAETISDPVMQTRVAVLIAIAQTHLVDVAGAIATIDKGKQFAAGITSTAFHNSALEGIAVAQAEAGDVIGAKQTVGTITDFRKAGGLARIATAQARTEDAAAALATIDEAKRTAEGINDPVEKAHALSAIVLSIEDAAKPTGILPGST